MVAIPGTLKADGSIDHSQGASGTACVIPSTTKNKQAAWEFVKFWVGVEAQTRYATDIEAVLGVGGCIRHPKSPVFMRVCDFE